MRHEKHGAKQTRNAHQRDDATHRPGRTVREETDQRRPDDTRAVLNRADQRRYSARARREGAERTGDRIGDNNAGR